MKYLFLVSNAGGSPYIPYIVTAGSFEEACDKVHADVLTRQPHFESRDDFVENIVEYGVHECHGPFEEISNL